MLDFLYTVFIAPLEYWMQAALVWSHGQCGHWGWAIVAMSLVVNTVILPIYVLAERWQQEEQRIRLGFQDKESMFNRAFKGQEKFAMVSTMRRQAGYTAILSMRSSLGFFLQIPFFFAAYHFLSHYGALSGVSFLGLPDLSQPDGLLVLGSLHINVMPWIMTFINLASALIYTQNLTRRDKIQLYAVALIFLVLLYDAASGLVLYWTCNNIYSLAKNIVYAQMDRFGISAQTFDIRIPMRSVEPLGTARWSDGYVFFLWFAALVISGCSSDQAVFLAGDNRMLLGHVARVGFALATLFALIEIVRCRMWRRYWVACVLAAVLAYIVFKFTYQYEFVSLSRHGSTLRVGVASMVPVLAITSVKLRLHDRIFAPAHTQSLLIPALVWFVILLAFYMPIKAYVSDPESFSSPGIVLARLMAYGALIGAASLLLAYVFRVLRSDADYGFWAAFFTLLLTVYAFLMPLDVGTIDGFQLAKPQRLFSNTNLCVDLVLAAVFSGGFLGLFWRFLKASSFCRGLLVCLSSIACLSICYGLWTTQPLWTSAESRASVKIPEWNKRLLGFSKDKTNTLVLILDMFPGVHMDTILNRHPEIKTIFKDFTWYADTLATGPGTATSLASIIGGKACTPEVLNENPNLSVSEKVNRAYADVINRWGKDTDVAFMERNWLEPQLMNTLVTNNPLVIRYMGLSVFDYYAKKHHIVSDISGGDDFLISVGVFGVVPWSLKNFVYNGGNWIANNTGKRARQLQVERHRDWAFMQSFPELANTDAKKPTFKVIYSEMTHRPWFMHPGACTMCEKQYPPDVNKSLINQGHLQVTTCTMFALGKWLDWMKTQGVYDNTTIIIASDHGVGRLEPSAMLMAKRAHATHPSLVIDRSKVILADAGEMIFGRFPKSDSSRIRYWRACGQRIDTVYGDLKLIPVRGTVREFIGIPEDYVAPDSE